MADYYAQIHGLFAGDIAWSTGVHITSSQSETALATTWNNAVTDFWASGTHGVETLCPTNTGITQTSVATLNGTMHEVSKTRTPNVASGTDTADTLPYQEAIVLSLRGNSIQKHGRGRMFLPALAEDQVNGDVLVSAAQTRISNAIRAVWAAVNADGSTFFVTNKKPLKDGTPAFQKTVVTTPLVSNKPARQSRRVKKVPATYV